jgi:O-succinylbenzoate synthase
MKSSYELAMERLNKSAPATKLSADQKKRIAELESKCKAKIAERELALKSEVAAAASAGEFEKVEQLQQQLVIERKKLEAECEEKKEALRNARAKPS